MFLSVVSAAVMAATVVPQSVEQLTDRATVVVRGTVEAQQSAFAEGVAGIYTFSQVRVTEALKGAPGVSIRVRQAGGTVGNKSVSLPGDAVLTSGEDVLLFLHCPAEKAECTVVGLSMGKYHLAPGADGAVAATRDFSQISFARGAAPSAGPERYDAVARRVRAQAGATR
jgi:hypothetical protein